MKQFGLGQIPNVTQSSEGISSLDLDEGDEFEDHRQVLPFDEKYQAIVGKTQRPNDFNALWCARWR